MPWDPAAFDRRSGEPLVTQDLADRRRRRRALLSRFTLQHGTDLGRTPQRVLGANLENAGDHLGHGLLWMMPRRARAVRQPGGALALVALDPFLPMRR